MQLTIIIQGAVNNDNDSHLKLEGIINLVY